MVQKKPAHPDFGKMTVFPARKVITKGLKDVTIWGIVFEGEVYPIRR